MPKASKCGVWRPAFHVLTVALAVSFAMVFGAAWLPYAHSNRIASHVTGMESAYDGWTVHVPDDWPSPLERIFQESRYGVIVIHETNAETNLPELYLLSVERSGWPVPATQAAYAAKRTSLPMGQLSPDPGNSVVRSWDRGLGSGFTMMGAGLPMRPVFPGFLISWGVFFAISFGIIGVARMMWGLGRRRLRGARGRCLRCGYDRAGDASDRCPECGHEPAAA